MLVSCLAGDWMLASYLTYDWLFHFSLHAGIPVDMIGGTSIGAFMGGLYADETDVGNMRERAAEFSAGMSKLWNKIVDLTYPYTAMFSGYRFNKGYK